MHINTKMQKIITQLFGEIQFHENLCHADKMHWIDHIKRQTEAAEMWIRKEIEETK